jgi:vancomycin resistance protein YoaR
MALMAIGLPILLLVGYESAYTDKVYPGVSVMGMNMAGMGRAEAEAALNQRFNQLYRQGLTLRLADRTWPVTREEIGLRFDVSRTLTTVMAVGRSGSLPDNLLEQLRIRGAGLTVQPVLDLNEVQRTGYLNRLAKEVDRPPINASVRVEGSMVSAAASQKGLRLNIEATSQRLAQALIAGDSKPVDLAIEEIVPAVGDGDVAEAVSGAATILSAPVTLVLDERIAVLEGDQVVVRQTQRTWVMDPVRLGSLLGFRQKVGADGRTKLAATLSEEAVTTFVNDIARDVNQPVRDARLERDDKTGKLTPSVQSQDGRAVRVADAVKAIVAAATGSQKRIALPVDVQRPQAPMEEIPNMGIVELVSKGTSIYKPSTDDRAFNVRLAAQRLHGVVIPPGQIFSFNKALGPVSADTGYRESYSIIGDYTVRDTGGGVCQVATTVFRAIFFGGYSIDDRSAHAYRIRRYEQESIPLGFDATVYDPGTDLKFKNDGPSYLLIQTTVDEAKGTLAVSFYGTKPDWTVTWSGPVLESVVPHGPKLPDTTDATLAAGTRILVQPAEDGVTATITRLVKRGAQVLRTYTFKWVYRQSQEQWIVGTKK